jgi:hypothetical protein
MTLDFDKTNVGDFIVILRHSFSGPYPATCERVERKTKTLLITEQGSRINQKGWEAGGRGRGYIPYHAVTYDEEGKRLMAEYRLYLRRTEAARKLSNVAWGNLSMEQLEAVTVAAKAAGIPL